MNGVQMKKGFTLAEVLITLGIIGIVAALTIPQVVKNYQHKALETAFKKQYSLLTQAVAQMEADGFCTSPGCYVGTENTSEFYNTLTKYFKVLRYCGDMKGIEVDEYDKFCFPKDQYDSKYTDYSKKRSGIQSSMFDDGQFYTADGSLYALEFGCTLNMLLISVDVNGRMKGPNALGHDVFTFQLVQKGGGGVILPMGAEGTMYYNNNSYCTTNSGEADPYNGIGCTSKALSEKDYFKNLP